MPVVGVDGYRGGWVAAEIDDSGFRRAFVADRFEGVLEGSSEAAVIGVDIPIGLPGDGPRRAVREAAAFVGGRRSSVFLTPPRPVLEASTFAEAVSLARNLTGAGISQQAYALRHRILEVDDRAYRDERIHEVHPEVSFAAINGRPLSLSKKTHDGVFLRRALLEREGIEIPPTLGDAGTVPVDDVYDAAVAAWSARRIAAGQATSLPDPPETDDRGHRIAIWY